MDRDPQTGRAPDGEQGFTLVELLAATTISMVVMLAAFAALQVANRGDTENRARTESLLDGRGALAKLSRDLRVASAVTVESPTRIRVTKPGAINTAARSVLYDCSVGADPTLGRTCNRAEGASPPSSASFEVLRGVMNADIFTRGAINASGSFVANAAGPHMRIKLRIRAGEDGFYDNVALDDGVTMRGLVP